MDGHLGVDGRRPGSIWEHFGLQMGRFGGVLGRENHAKTMEGVIKITLSHLQLVEWQMLDMCSLSGAKCCIQVGKRTPLMGTWGSMGGAQEPFGSILGPKWEMKNV